MVEIILKTCPFCGSDAKFMEKNENSYAQDPLYIKCTKCWCKTECMEGEMWECGIGTYSIRNVIIEKLAFIWNSRYIKPREEEA